MVHKKLNLPQKICLACQKPFAWRKKWQKDWEQVKYCSHRCQKNSSTKNSPKKILIISLFFLSMTISNKKLFAQICEIPAKETSSKNIEHKKYIDEVLIKNKFYRDFFESGGWGPCREFFYEVWKRQF